MIYYLTNNRNQSHKFIIVEKINNHSKEMTLLDILKLDYGFSEKMVKKPLTLLEKVKIKLGFPVKNKIFFPFGCLVAEINNNTYEVYFDTWSVEMRRNGVTIFDATKFENEEFLQLII